MGVMEDTDIVVSIAPSHLDPRAASPYASKRGIRLISWSLQQPASSLDAGGQV
jgi:hypothetical protein